MPAKSKSQTPTPEPVVKLTKVSEFPEQTGTVRTRWSGPVLETLRAHPGEAFQIATGARKLIQSRAGYLRTQEGIEARVVLSDDGETATLYARSN